MTATHPGTPHRPADTRPHFQPTRPAVYTPHHSDDGSDDGGLWHPAPLRLLLPPLATALTLVGGTAAIIFGPDLLGHLLSAACRMGPP